MPGLLENEDDDGELDQMQLDGDSIHEDAPDTTIQLKPRPPNSVPALAFGPPPTKSIKPHSSGPKSAKSSKSAAVSNLEDHECPICGKTVRTDNQGLNTHIDFCLSRGVIRQAHAEATQNSDKRKLSTSRKPASKGKHKA
jgi:DNA polymerase kappa